jgi:hypothetical protein
MGLVFLIVRLWPTFLQHFEGSEGNCPERERSEEQQGSMQEGFKGVLVKIVVEFEQ